MKCWMNVLRPGALSSIQDLGREGFRSSGVPLSGAMDIWAARAANLLVENEPTAAVIEFTLSGPTISFNDDTVVAFTGSRFQVTGPRAIPWNRSVYVRASEILSLDFTAQGARGFLAVRGGFDVPMVLGSRSTYLRGGWGGFCGRALKAGDAVPIHDVGPIVFRERRLRDGLFPRHRNNVCLRVLPGPQWGDFTSQSQETFLATEYQVSTDCDRMGIRLQGPLLKHVTQPDIWPEGIVTGAIQVPANGQPIILCSDQPVTGGYTKIATVVGADLSYLAYLKPGDKIRFSPCCLADAGMAWLKREQDLREGVI